MFDLSEPSKKPGQAGADEIVDVNESSEDTEMEVPKPAPVI